MPTCFPIRLCAVFLYVWYNERNEWLNECLPTWMDEQAYKLNYAMTYTPLPLSPSLSHRVAPSLSRRQVFGRAQANWISHCRLQFSLLLNFQLSLCVYCVCAGVSAMVRLFRVCLYLVSVVQSFCLFRRKWDNEWASSVQSGSLEILFTSSDRLTPRAIKWVCQKKKHK